MCHLLQSFSEICFDNLESSTFFNVLVSVNYYYRIAFVRILNDDMFVLEDQMLLLTDVEAHCCYKRKKRTVLYG